ncbi:MAG: sulfite exporter TauE/SafE family protein, partial [Rhodothermales bacterium]|nr:sulfite exporter TauE/SafE family protein [Rhodothermales bacterium]
AATTGSAAAGAATMAAFGLGTVPALAGVALVGGLIRPAWRARLHLAGGVLVVLLGLLTIVRATPAAHFLHGHPAPMEHAAPALPAHDAGPPLHGGPHAPH